MDIEGAIRRDELGAMLREFVRQAAEKGSPPEETLAALMDMSATIYAVELSGASKKQRRRAKRAFIRLTTAAIEQLPTAQMDELIERRLSEEGF